MRIAPVSDNATIGLLEDHFPKNLKKFDRAGDGQARFERFSRLVGRWFDYYDQDGDGYITDGKGLIKNGNNELKHFLALYPFKESSLPLARGLTHKESFMSRKDFIDNRWMA